MKKRIQIGGYDLDPDIILGVGPLEGYDPHDPLHTRYLSSDLWHLRVKLLLGHGEDYINLGNDREAATQAREELIKQIWPD